jgi:hypothetical protein
VKPSPAVDFTVDVQPIKRLPVNIKLLFTKDGQKWKGAAIQWGGTKQIEAAAPSFISCANKLARKVMQALKSDED